VIFNSNEFLFWIDAVVSSLLSSLLSSILKVHVGSRLLKDTRKKTDIDKSFFFSFHSLFVCLFASSRSLLANPSSDANFAFLFLVSLCLSPPMISLLYVESLIKTVEDTDHSLVMKLNLPHDPLLTHLSLKQS
jgi:hypothetical protein